MAAIRLLPRAVGLARPATTKFQVPTTSKIGSRISARSFSVVRSLKEKYYTQSHEWIELDSDQKTGSIGISAHAASALGDIVFVELPEKGAELKAGDAMGAVESVKSASDLYIPLAGKIIETNHTLEEKPGLINQSPENEGWIAKVEVGEGGADQIKELKLMDATDYKKFSE